MELRVAHYSRHESRPGQADFVCAINNCRAILACVQVITTDTGAVTTSADGATEAPGGSEALANDLYALVVHTHRNCNADLFEAVGELELTLTQIKLLHHLDGAPSPITLKEAAEQVHVSLPAASRTVDDLVRRALATRAEDAEDRRMKRVAITPAGGAVIRRLNAARLSGLQQFLETLTDTEREALGGALSVLLERPEVNACRLETEPE